MTERLWFKIGETAQLVGAAPKELRYWEKVIPELKPRRSKGNLRYYHQDELVKLQRIRQWLLEGFTVADCRELLRGLPITPTKPPSAESGEIPKAQNLAEVLSAMRALLQRLQHPVGEIHEIPQTVPIRRPKAVRPKPEKPQPKLATSTLKAGSKGETPALGRMWSEGRLPLDWED